MAVAFVWAGPSPLRHGRRSSALRCLEFRRDTGSISIPDGEEEGNSHRLHIALRRARRASTANVNIGRLSATACLANARIEECAAGPGGIVFPPRIPGDAGVAARAAETTAKGRILPSVAVRYADPATEFTVVRLTDPAVHQFPAGQRQSWRHRAPVALRLRSGRQVASLPHGSKEQGIPATDRRRKSGCVVHSPASERARILAFRWARVW